MFCDKIKIYSLANKYVYSIWKEEKEEEDCSIFLDENKILVRVYSSLSLSREEKKRNFIFFETEFKWDIVKLQCVLIQF